MNSKKRIAALAILLGLAGLSFAQTPQPSESDSLKVIELKDVVVTSMKHELKLIETPAQLSVVNSLDCKKLSAFTVADVLKYEPGISMGGDGVWATNINVRGLSENRLVTLVDGNRVETSTDLTASLSMIDVNDIQRIEVIKGAQSSLFGSGAMGGIVNMITKDGYFSDKTYLHGNATAGYASVNNNHSEYLSLNAGGKRWFVKVNGSYGHANDVKTPEGILPNSGFTTNNLGARMGFKLAENHVVKLQFQRNWSKDVGIPGGTAFPINAIAKYSDIGRTLFNGSYEITNLSGSFKSLKLSGFYQNIIRNVEMQPHTVTTSLMPNGNTQVTAPQLFTPHAVHTTFGGQLQGTWEFGEHNTLIVGVDAWQRSMTSKREKYINVSIVNPAGDTIKTNKVERFESPLPNCSFTSAGLFAQDEMHFLENRLTLTVGGRLDGIFVINGLCHDVDSVITNGGPATIPATQRVTFEAGKTTDLSWSANMGLLYKVGEKTELVMNAARSYRAASLEERFKYIDLSSKVQLGNPNLKPEKGYSVDFGVRHWGEKFDLQGSVFANYLTDMIVETNGIFIYSLADGSTIDTLPALVYDNVDQAMLYGVDFSVDYHIIDGLQAYMTGAYIVGRNLTNKTYLPNIPPMSGRLGVAYTYPNVGAVNLSVMAAGAKEEGMIAEGEKATKGYYRIDLTLNSKRFEIGRCGLQFFGGIDNLTNVAYTNFLSTNRGNINFEPGRNFYIRANFTF